MPNVARPKELRNVAAPLDSAARAWAAPLVQAAGSAFRALYLYGSVLRPDFDPKVSNVNLLIVVSDYPFDRLERMAPIVAERVKLAEAGNRFHPLVLTETQIRTSSDVFPMDFVDLLEGRALLDGQDVLATLEVSLAHLRHQCEYELQSKLIGLRQAYLRQGGETGAAQKLAVAAWGGTATLYRHLLTLAGAPHPEDPERLLGEVARAYHIDPEALAVPLLARREPAPDEPTARRRYASYLAALESLVAAVNALPAH